MTAASRRKILANVKALAPVGAEILRTQPVISSGTPSRAGLGVVLLETKTRK